jgi:hypothetical protein
MTQALRVSLYSAYFACPSMFQAGMLQAGVEKNS